MIERAIFLIAGVVAATAALRTLPFCLWALSSKRVAWSGKLAAAIAFGALVLLAYARDRTFGAELCSVALGLLYYLGVCAALVWLTLRRRVAMRRWALGLALFTVCLVLPGLFVRAPGGVILLMMGWELFFSSYSYAIDAPRSERDGTWQQGLFFLLVNPALSYPERGRWLTSAADAAPRGLSRCVSGSVLLCAQAITTDMPLSLAQHARSLGPVLGDYVAHFAGSAVGLARAFCGQAGMATIQLGLLAMLGFQGLERFDQPWRATSPADFWRRWNVYLGLWFKRYVFNPISYSLARRRTAGDRARTGIAVLVTFVIAGIAHDAVWFFLGADHGQGVLAFTLAGAAILAFATPWLSTAAAGKRGVGQLWVARGLSWHMLLLTVWIFAWHARRG